jgi:hypothetical protein
LDSTVFLSEGSCARTVGYPSAQTKTDLLSVGFNVDPVISPLSPRSQKASLYPRAQTRVDKVSSKAQTIDTFTNPQIFNLLIERVYSGHAQIEISRKGDDNNKPKEHS